MDARPRCPACDGAPARSWPALVAPFIADYALSEPVGPTALNECGTCGSRWFADGFTEPELDRLYAGYREAGYFAARHRHEPWYTEATNRGIGADPARVEARQHALGDFLGTAGFPGPFATVLDHGGDAGQFIPLTLAKNAYVYEVSGVAPVPGVEAIERAEDLEPGGYDVVLSIHVLEHIPEPLALAQQLAALPAREGGILYVEVPLELPRLGCIGTGPRSAAYLDRLRRAPTLLKGVDLYSTAVRVKFGVIPPLGFPKLHEHQNFFSADGLRRMLQRAGLDVIALEPVAGHGAEAGGAAISAVARVAGSA